MGVVAERAGDEDVESGVAGFAGGGDQIRAGDGAEFGADEDGGAFLGGGASIVAFAAAFDVAAFGADEVARPGEERSERDPVLLVGLLDAGGLEVFGGSWR